MSAIFARIVAMIGAVLVFLRRRGERANEPAFGDTPAIPEAKPQGIPTLKLPTGLPHIFTGLKIAAVGVMAGAITDEFLGGGKGFGELIRVAASQLNTPRVFTLILYLSLVGLALFAFVVWVQRRFVFWHKDRIVGGES